MAAVVYDVDNPGGMLGADNAEAHHSYCELVAGLDVSEFDAQAVSSELAAARQVQRVLDGLITRLGQRANQLAKRGRSAAADEVLLGSGTVGSTQAKREAARAAATDQMPAVGRALSAGAVSGDHVDVLARATADLTPEQSGALDLDSLIDDAGRLPVETFRKKVRRAVDTAIGDHGLKDTIAKQQASEFRHWVDGRTGMGRFAGALDPERYEQLVNAVELHVSAIANRSSDPVTKGPNLAAQALVELVIASGDSATGGAARVPSITVIVDHDTIVHGVHDASVLETRDGHELPPQTLARLACDAVIRRVGLDERGVPLNVGRKYRTATDGQWAAINATYNSCAWPGCRASLGRCQAHHIHEWEHGGPTDLDNLVPLCSQHHHLVHEGQWTIKLLPDRGLKIYRPDGEHHTTIPPPSRASPP